MTTFVLLEFEAMSFAVRARLDQPAAPGMVLYVGPGVNLPGREGERLSASGTYRLCPLPRKSILRRQARYLRERNLPVFRAEFLSRRLERPGRLELFPAAPALLDAIDVLETHDLVIYNSETCELRLVLAGGNRVLRIRGPSPRRLLPLDYVGVTRKNVTRWRRVAAVIPHAGSVVVLPSVAPAAGFSVWRVPESALVPDAQPPSGTERGARCAHCLEPVKRLLRQPSKAVECPLCAELAASKPVRKTLAPPRNSAGRESAVSDGIAAPRPQPRT